jgi:hypothetical protein
MIINKKLVSLTLSSIVCASLTACGGGSSSDTSGVNFNGGVDDIIGIAITSSNADEIISSGIGDPVKLTSDLVFLNDALNTDGLSIDSFTENSVTYECDTSGLMTVTGLGDTTTTSASYAYNYNNCEQYGVHYHGDIVVTDNVQEGTLASIWSNDEDWSVIQTSELTDFERTAPVSNGTTNKINGEMIIESSYIESTQVSQSHLTSSSLFYDVISSDASESSYDFSNLSYISIEDDVNNTATLSIDFIANHASDGVSIGEMQMATDTALTLESSVLQSGEVVFTTGVSSLLLEAVGNDNIDVALDLDGNSTYDVTLSSTTWSSFFD